MIAYAAGGALETVLDGTTGVFFRIQTPGHLVEAVRRFESLEFDHHAIRAHAERFDTAVFRRELLSAIDRALGARPPSGGRRKTDRLSV
ncbi:MAG: hypothetical protein NTZ05_15865 [Chloroflexi bacterium]|nr:hypothetical protein [Chloroflexota bacterium]